MLRFLVINGPNLNLLGTRQPDVYGTTTLGELEALCSDWGKALGAEVESFQSNHEGSIVDRLHDARGTMDGVVLNAGALSHYSYAIHDAIVASEVPSVEVHISNIREREPWRAVSVVEAACIHSIYGRGIEGYRWALGHLAAQHAGEVERIEYGSGKDQFGDLRIPPGDGSNALVVLIHGGFWKEHWTRDLMDGIAVDLVQHGVATLNLEYRRMGSGGGWPHTAVDVATGLDRIAELERLDIDVHRVAVLGHSAGGQLALWAGGRRGLAEGPGSDPLLQPELVVGLAPVSNLADAQERELGHRAVDHFLATAHEHTNVYRSGSPIEMLPLSVDQLIVHGTDDDAVPVEMSDEYVEAARQAGDSTTYLRLDGVDHMSLIDPQGAAWAAVRIHLLERL